MSCLTENDPRDNGYIALFVSIVWYKQITPEQALRLSEGRSFAKPEKTLTPEIMTRIKQIMKSTNFKNFDNIERLFRVNRYEIFQVLREEKMLKERGQAK